MIYEGTISHNSNTRKPKMKVFSTEKAQESGYQGVKTISFWNQFLSMSFVRSYAS